MKLIKDGALQVKVNDIIIHRDGDRELVYGFGYNSKNPYPIRINTEVYMLDGRYSESNENVDEDIIAIHRTETCKEEPATFESANDELMNTLGKAIETLNKPSRMIDLFAQGAAYVKDYEGDIWRCTALEPQFFGSENKWECAIGAFYRVLFSEATVAENPEKPKKVVYNWLYRLRNQTIYFTTSGKYETSDNVRTSLPGYDVTFIEKIEHSREEV